MCCIGFDPNIPFVFRTKRLIALPNVVAPITLVPYCKQDARFGIFSFFSLCQLG
jgi:hypothetical protein